VTAEPAANTGLDEYRRIWRQMIEALEGGAERTEKRA
jgi:hypothetical protein